MGVRGETGEHQRYLHSRPKHNQRQGRDDDVDYNALYIINDKVNLTKMIILSELFIARFSWCYGGGFSCWSSLAPSESSTAFFSAGITDCYYQEKTS